MKKAAILKAARKKAGMPNFPKWDVIQFVCRDMGVAVPATWTARYQLMKQWAVPTKQPAVTPVKAAPVLRVEAPKAERPKAKLLRRAERVQVESLRD